MTRWSKLQSTCPEEVSPPFLLQNQKLYIVGYLVPNVFERVVKTAFYVSRAIFWESQYFWEKIFCLFFKLFLEFIQTSDKCRLFSTKFRISRQTCTLPVQDKVLEGKRFAGVSKFIKLLGVELENTEQLCACFSIGSSKKPYSFPEDQFGRNFVSKIF